MYIPKAFKEDNKTMLVEFMRAHSFATLVSIVDGSPFASHIPLVVQADDTGVTLLGHVAKANPHWQWLEQGETLAIFTGPHAYVSPSLYEKRESVPTWNYVAVHAYGTPRLLTYDQSRAAMGAMLETMMATFEATYLAQYDALTDRYREGMMQAIVGFEMRVTRLEGKYKLSQNRSHTDQATVAAALAVSQDAAEAGVGKLMTERL